MQGSKPQGRRYETRWRRNVVEIRNVKVDDLSKGEYLWMKTVEDNDLRGRGIEKEKCYKDT